MTRLLSRTAWGLAALLSVTVAIFSYRYLPRVLAQTLSPAILANLFARPWLDVHIAGAATALLIGPFQFLQGLRDRWRGLHRLLGRIYVTGCLVGGLGGLVMAFGSTAGPIATVEFAALAISWFYATSQAWRLAVAGRIAEHRAWMIRSFAMTFGAVTLRLYMPILPLFGLTALEGYRLTAYISWIPNLILVELWLRGAFGGRRLAGQAA